MTTSPLSGSIAKQVAAGLKSVMLPAVLTRTTQGAYDPITDTFTDPVIASFPCRGMVERYSTYTESARALMPSHRKVVLLAATLGTTPALNDKVTIQGETFTVQRIDTDPARATWELQGFKT